MRDCAQDPIQLSDSRVLQPETQITLADLCELFPVLMEIEIEAKSKQGPGGKPSPGQTVTLSPGNVPAGFRTPGGMPVPSQGGFSPGGGPASGPGGGGGGFVGSGGGGGRRGPQGPAGPPGPGTIEDPVTKTDGNFTVLSADPFIAVPGTSKTFDVEERGTAIFLLQAVFGDAAEQSRGQIGIRITPAGGSPTDYPLSANQTYTSAGGVADFYKTATSFWPIILDPGTYTAEIVLRGDANLPGPAPVGLPVSVEANATIPLSWTVIHT